MKTLKFLFILVSLIVLMACAKKDKEENIKKGTINLNVEKYIELLKTNKFDSLNIPAFSSEDIEALLMYRNDTQTVNIFPSSIISSYKPIGPKYKLGVLVLWTVESIRVVSVKGESINGRFPSQNPFIVMRSNPSEWVMDYNNEAYEIVSQAYYSWWEANKDKKFNQFKNIDPLETTDYQWH